MISTTQQVKLREAFANGTLKIQSVSPSGDVVWKRVLEVFRNEVPWEQIKAVTTPHGTKVLTGGHKIYVSPTDREKVEDLRPGDYVVSVVEGAILYVPILKIKDLPSRQFMYDLTADTWANFVSTQILLKNSPDKFYHFRPPEHEGRIGNYDKVFGQIWEDAELYEYLQRGLDWWNMFPPSTFSLSGLTMVFNQMPAWRTAVYWAAITHALFAVSLNWVADEFDYSIGGVSLSIDKSSKYESLKGNAEGQFDKATEAKVRTVKFIRGLQQPRFGIGIRSAFGPHTAKGVLSPRNFL